MESIWVLLATIVGFSLASFLALFLAIFRLRRHVAFSFNTAAEAMERRASNLGVIKKMISAGFPDEENLTSLIGKAQKKLNNVDKVSDIVKAEEILTQAISGVLTFASSNPSILKDSKFVKAQENLMKIEKKIEKNRAEYNEKVNKYNTVFVLAPQKWVAKVFRFTKAVNW